MNIYTSTINYSGKHKLDITIKSGDIFYAPTWKMVMAFKQNKYSKEEYTKDYLDIISRRFNNPKNDWKIKSLLKKEIIVFCCYCKPKHFCHRILLANYLAKNYGAIYKGEIEIL